LGALSVFSRNVILQSAGDLGAREREDLNSFELFSSRSIPLPAEKFVEVKGGEEGELESCSVEEEEREKMKDGHGRDRHRRKRALKTPVTLYPSFLFFFSSFYDGIIVITVL